MHRLACQLFALDIFQPSPDLKGDLNRFGCSIQNYISEQDFAALLPGG